MDTAIWSAILSAAAAIIVGVLNSHAQHQKTLAEIEKINSLQEYRLKKLEEKMDKHNNVIERTFVLEEKVKVANHRIDDLERRNVS